jgi:hypothetical protein
MRGPEGDAMLQFRCRCRQKITVPDAYSKKKVRCPGCHRAVPVPADAGGDTYFAAPAGKERSSRKRRAAPGWFDSIRASKESVVIAAMIIAFGTIWLLSELKWLPPFHWVWTLGLACAGILTLVIGGINKQTMVVGPYLIICAVFSVLRQTGQIALRVEIPVLVIAFGLWLFVVILLGHALPDLVSDD